MSGFTGGPQQERYGKREHVDTHADLVAPQRRATLPLPDERDFYAPNAKIEALVNQNESLKETVRKLSEELERAHERVPKEEVVRLQASVKELTEENDQLKAKLKNQLEMLVKRVENDPTAMQQLLADEINTLKDRLDLMVQENNLLLQQQHEMQVEAERLRDENRKMHAQYSHYISSGDRNKHMVEAASATIKKLQRDKDLLREQLDASLREADGLRSELTVASDKLRVAQYEINRNVNSAHMDAADWKKERDRLQQKIAELDQRILLHQQNEFEALKRLKDTNETLEFTRLEKDTAVSQVENKRKEISRLEDKIKRINQEHADKLKQVQKSAEEKAKKQMTNLREELRHTQIQNAQLQTQADRLAREKKTAEAELERTLRTNLAENVNPQNQVLELSRKLSRLTEERDELEREHENYRGTVKRNQIQWEQEREQMNAQITEMQRKTQRIERTLEETKEEKDRLLIEINKVQRQNQNLKLEFDELDKRHKEHISELMASHKLQLSDLSRRLNDAAEERQLLERQLEAESRNLDKQHFKWKEEQRTTIERQERTISEQRMECERLLARNEDLTHKVELLFKEKTDIQRQVEKSENQQLHLRSLLETANKRAEDNEAQIAQLMAREAELLREKKQLHYELDRLSLDLERVDRDRLLARRYIGELKADKYLQTAATERALSAALQQANSDSLYSRFTVPYSDDSFGEIATSNNPAAEFADASGNGAEEGDVEKRWSWDRDRQRYVKNTRRSIDASSSKKESTERKNSADYDSDAFYDTNYQKMSSSDPIRRRKRSVADKKSET